jgi:methylglutamate dehydrogenase subunit B
MRISCPFCGPRGNEEFTYRGDAAPLRPRDPHAPIEAWVDYVYLRDNVAGPMEELWWHGGGCRAWLVVTRDTKTHEITDVSAAREVAVSRLPAEAA